MRPAAAVIAPMAPIVIRMPTANRADSEKARRVVMATPWPLMKPMIRGMLAR